MHSSRGKHNPLWRRMGEHLLDRILCGGLLAHCSYQLGLQGRLSVTRHAFQLEQGRQLAQPLTIAFVSDFHAGPATHPPIFDRVFAEITAHHPDILLLGGGLCFLQSQIYGGAGRWPGAMFGTPRQVRGAG